MGRFESTAFWKIQPLRYRTNKNHSIGMNHNLLIFWDDNLRKSRAFIYALREKSLGWLYPLDVRNMVNGGSLPQAADLRLFCAIRGRAKLLILYSFSRSILVEQPAWSGPPPSRKRARFTNLLILSIWVSVHNRTGLLLQIVE